MVLMIGEELDVWLGAIVSVRECKMFWAWMGVVGWKCCITVELVDASRVHVWWVESE